MASIFQPTITRKSPDGTKTTERSPTWWIEYFSPHLGRLLRVKGYRDKKATQMKATELEKKAERAAEGAADPFEQMKKLPLDEHLNAYEIHLSNKGDGTRHIRTAKSHVKGFFGAAKAVRLDELKPLDAENFLKGLKDGGMGPKARNEYLSDLRSFYRWCIRTKRVSADAEPTLTLSKANVAEDIRRERRVLPPKELALFLNAARTCLLDAAVRRRKKKPLSVEEIRILRRKGEEHLLIYTTAIWTGLRRGELKQLRWGDLDLDPSRPQMRVRASTSKNGREAHQAVRKDLAEQLRIWRSMHSKAQELEMDPQALDLEKVFHIPRDMCLHLQATLKAAGIDYEDAQGRVFDFHSLRHCTSTYLQMAKVAPTLAQDIMRHADIRLTLEAYTDLALFDKAAAVETLPSLPLAFSPVPAPTAQALRATGTDGPIQASPGLSSYNKDCNKAVGVTQLPTTSTLTQPVSPVQVRACPPTVP